MENISITEYKSEYASELLRLLLELHSSYFHKNASKQIRELKVEKDIKASYESYINEIVEIDNHNWKAFVAVTPGNKIIGFIIGSISKDDALVNASSGIIEDWFVEDEYRGQKTGMNLYNELETWFKEKGCSQVKSDTWEGNELSVKAHLQMGFFVSGIMFSKKLN